MSLSRRIDVLLASLNIFYTPPWMRILPYMAGIVTGVVLVHIKSRKFKPSLRSQRTYWIVFGMIIVQSLFVTYFKNVPVWLFAASFSVGRFALALVWGSALIACALGLGGVGNRILSGAVFVHLDRLSYAMYVLNPVLVVAMNAGQQATAHYELVPTVRTKPYGVAYFRARFKEIGLNRNFMQTPTDHQSSGRFGAELCGSFDCVADIRDAVSAIVESICDETRMSIKPNKTRRERSSNRHQLGNMNNVYIETTKINI